MKRMRILVMVLAVTCISLNASVAKAQSAEERFNDLFITAGYATAFGAALGTAVLGLTSDPAANLQYIAIGASLGFIGGSVLGSYVIFSPMMGVNETTGGSLLTATSGLPGEGLVVRPSINASGGLQSIETGMTLFSF